MSRRRRSGGGSYINKVLSVAGMAGGTTPIGANLLTNGNFETAGAGGADVFGTWAETAGDGAVADETTLFHGGAHAAKLTAGATANTTIGDTLSTLGKIVPGATYQLTFWTRGDGTNAGRFRVYDVTNALWINLNTTTGVAGTSYAQVSYSFQAPAGCTRIGIYFACPPVNTGIAYFDDVEVRILSSANNALVAYWPLNEASGGVAYDISGNGRHGSHTAVSYNAEGIGDGNRAITYDGTASYTNIYSAALNTAFNGAEGTLMCWAKVANAGVWTDGAARYVIYVSVDDNNRMMVQKATSSNMITQFYIAGGVSDTNSDAISSTGWLCYAMTWAVSGDLITYYRNGTSIGTDTGLGAWAGNLVSTGCVIGAGSTTPQYPFSGSIAHVALWTKALAPGDILYLSTIR